VVHFFVTLAIGARPGYRANSDFVAAPGIRVETIVVHLLFAPIAAIAADQATRPSKGNAANERMQSGNREPAGVSLGGGPFHPKTHTRLARGSPREAGFKPT
jgi:hypothetical protein